MRTLVLLCLTSLLCTAFANFYEAENDSDLSACSVPWVRTTSPARYNCSVSAEQVSDCS